MPRAAERPLLRRIPATDRRALRAAWGEAARPDAAVARAVSEILLDVERRGDRALLEWTERLDGVRLTAARLRVPEREIDAACRAVPAPLREALREAALRIEAFAAATVPRGFETGHGSGIVTGVRVDALESAGLYVPGGKASYPSTVLMSALPARVAGVPRRVMVTPPDRRGRIAPLVLAAARECGVHEVYRLGGAQAVAALALGTRSVRPVDVVTGPGNAYVAEAKRQVMGRVRIDSIAGPSELALLADETADAATVAVRLMAQAEHDEVTRVALVSWVPALFADVERELRRRLARAPRRAILRASLPAGLAVTARGPAGAIAAVNELAPEHLELHVREPRRVLERIRGAGAVFLGAGTPTALGDYGAGPNHTLPTGRTARFASALSAADFVRQTSVVEADPSRAGAFFAAAAALARAEGLSAHAETLEAVFDSDSSTSGRTRA